MSLCRDALYFLEHYKDSVQAKVQGFKTEDPGLIFRKGVYCLMTPATKAQAANETLGRLFENDFIFKASLEEIAACLREPPYIRFHNQKAGRIVAWREKGLGHIGHILAMDDEKKMRRYLVDNAEGFNYKEASHFLRNIGRGLRLAVLDRHILAFMKEEKMIEDTALTPARYGLWEALFCSWADSIGQPVPAADFALWAAGVKKHNPRLSYETILLELE